MRVILLDETGIKIITSTKKQMYLTLLDATEKAINELISAQRACEEQYILSSQEEENSKKAESIKIKEKL